MGYEDIYRDITKTLQDEREPRKPRREDFPSGFWGTIQWLWTTFNWYQGANIGIEYMAAEYQLQEVKPKDFDKEFIYSITQLIGLMSNPAATPEDIEGEITDILNAPGLGARAFRGFFGGLAALQGLTNYGAPVMRLMGQSQEHKFRTFRPPINDLWAMERRGFIAPAELEEWAADQGLPETAIEGYKEISRLRLPLRAWIDDWVRKGRPGEGWQVEAKRRGLTTTEVKKLERLSWNIPPLPDIIRMATREAWRDDVASAYGFDQDYPGNVEEWVSKLGFKADWLKRYWRAHWRLPSYRRAREMLARTDFSEADMENLLRFADVPATFRKYLTQIAYRTLTRVDIRRMYKLGVIKSFDELVSKYKDFRYNTEDAIAMAQFTQMYVVEDEIEATKGEILDAYEIGRFDRNEAKARLVDIGKLDWVAEVYLAKIDYKRTRKLAKRVVDLTEDLYIAGKLTRNAVKARLGKVPLSVGEICQLLAEWDLEIENKIKIPTKGELRDWFLDQEITADQYRDYLGRRHYATEDITHYLNDARREMQERMEKELKRERKEAQDARKAAVKNVHAIAIADKKVHIAECRVAISDYEMAISETVKPEIIEHYKEEILVLKHLIAVIRRNITVERLALREQLAELAGLSV